MIKLILVVFVLIALAGGTFTGLTAFGVVPDVLGLGLTFAGSTARSGGQTAATAGSAGVRGNRTFCPACYPGRAGPASVHLL